MPLGEINWSELFTGSSGANLGPVVFIVGIVLVVIVSIGASYWHKARLIRLKEQMVERGFTAEEIATVISAGEAHGRMSQPTHSFGGTSTGAPDSREAMTN